MNYSKLHESFEDTINAWMTENVDPKWVNRLSHDLCFSVKNTIKNDTEIQVKHPTHYNSHPSGVECIEVVHDWDYCLANAAKYQWRKGLKDGQPSEKEDMKALQYLKFRVQYSPELGRELTLEDVHQMINDKIELILLRKRDKLSKEYQYQDWEYAKNEDE